MVSSHSWLVYSRSGEDYAGASLSLSAAVAWLPCGIGYSPLDGSPTVVSVRSLIIQSQRLPNARSDEQYTYLGSPPALWSVAVAAVVARQSQRPDHWLVGHLLPLTSDRLEAPIRGPRCCDASMRGKFRKLIG
jgi:hypothetical protein